MSILTSPALRWPSRLGPELHFDGTNNSSVDCGAIHNAAAKLWASVWIKPNSTFSSGVPAGNMEIFAKWVGGTNKLMMGFDTASGKMFWQLVTVGGGSLYLLTSTRTSWIEGVWHHLLGSLSSAAGARFIINGGTALTDADTTAAPNGGNLTIGNYAPNGGEAWNGEIRDVAIGIDDLSATEERDLLKGIIPADATDFWRLNEGHGRSALSLGSDATTGTIDTAPTWEYGHRGYARW